MLIREVAVQSPLGAVEPTTKAAPESVDKGQENGGSVPKELKSRDEFKKLLESASEIRVLRRGDEAKIKLRAKDALYTFRTSTADADSMIKGTKTPVVEY
jgi:hypothetical protein